VQDESLREAVGDHGVVLCENPGSVFVADHGNVAAKLEIEREVEGAAGVARRPGLETGLGELAAERRRDELLQLAVG